MSLYRPAAFASDDRAAIARLFDEHPFATLITAGAGEPQVSHLPLLHQSAPGAHGSLVGHMARANPHWCHFGDGATRARLCYLAAARFPDDPRLAAVCA